MQDEPTKAADAGKCRLDRTVGGPVPKRCEPCRATGAIHCADPENCGGPWDKRHDEAERRREKERLMSGIL